MGVMLFPSDEEGVMMEEEDWRKHWIIVLSQPLHDDHMNDMMIAATPPHLYDKGVIIM